MHDPSPQADPIGMLADEFVQRYRKGERPSLTEYCGRHPELAARIRELFPALVMMEEFGLPPDGSLGDSHSARAPGSGRASMPEYVGDYRVLSEIGRGGMGVVYEAEQESLGRHVALKILPFHAAKDARILERFRREARAAARLHHTNIVPIFAVGDHEGLHYYVMQFIRGLGLDQVLVELRRLRYASRSDGARDDRSGNAPVVAAGRRSAPVAAPEAPSAALVAEALLSGQYHLVADVCVPAADPLPTSSGASLPVGMSARDGSSSCIHLRSPETHTSLSGRGQQYWHSVARIGVQVADALAYANSQGVLHRDIKPSNLLLDTQGIVWVTDFGLAQATGSVDLTHSGDFLGTLRYLAPERLLGKSDQRSDIYGLGITLYELLTLRPAFQQCDRNQLIQQLSHEEPPLPRSLEPQIPVDLETIVLGAMAKDPADRYPTASALAEDLRRFLADRPILARRSRWLERSWRWCRRNPAVASLTASLLLVLLLGFGGVVWGWREAEQARKDERRARQEADASAQEVGQGLQRLKAANALLDQGRVFADWRNWDDADSAFTKAIQVRPDHVQAWEERGHLYARLGLWELALDDWSRAFELQEPALTWRWLWHALLCMNVGDTAGYYRVHQRMHQVFTGTNRPAFAVDLVRTSSLAPHLYNDTKELAELAEAVVASNPKVHSYLYVCGAAQYRAGHYEQAIQRCRESLEADTNWGPRPLNYPILAMAHHRLGDFDQARQALGTASEALERLTDQMYQGSNDSWVIDYGAEERWPIDRLDWLEFNHYYREAHSLLGLPPLPADARCHVLRGRAFAGMRRPKEADAEFRMALHLQPDDVQIRIETCRNRAYYGITRQAFAEAADQYAQATALSPDDSDLWYFQGTAHLLAGNACTYQRVCQQMLDHFAGNQDPAVANDVVELCVLAPDSLPDMTILLPVGEIAARWYPGSSRVHAAAHYRAGNYHEAIQCFQKAAKLHHQRCFDVLFLAMAHRQLGHCDEARQSIDKAKEWMEKANRRELSSLNSNQPAWGDWPEPLTVPLLLHEAETLVGSSS